MCGGNLDIFPEILVVLPLSAEETSGNCFFVGGIFRKRFAEV
jgi:hypothetical protein